MGDGTGRTPNGSCQYHHSGNTYFPLLLVAVVPPVRSLPSFLYLDPNHVNHNCHFLSSGLPFPTKFWRSNKSLVALGFLCMTYTEYWPLDSPGHTEERRGGTETQYCCYSIAAFEPEVIPRLLAKCGKHVCLHAHAHHECS